MDTLPEVDSQAGSTEKRKNLTHSVLDGLFWTTSSFGVQAILRLVGVSIMARLLTPEEFGLMGAAGVVLGLTSYITEFGLFSVIEQRPVIEERHLRTALTIYTIMGTLFGLAIFFCAGIIANFFRMPELVPILQVVALAYPFLAFEALPRALMKRQLRFRWLAGLSVVSYIVGLGLVGVGMAQLGYGVWSLIGATFAGLIMSIVILWIVQPYPKRPLIDRGAFSDLTYMGGGFVLGRVFIYAGEQVDNLVVGRWLGAEALGIYGRAYQLLVFPVSLFGTALKMVLVPTMSKIQGEPERLGAAYRRSMALIALVFLPISAGAIVLSQELILTVLGSQWVAVIVPFQILAAGIFFRSNYKISDSMVQATGEVYRRAGRSAMFGVLTLIGALVGQFWGVSGVAFGVLIALGLNSFLLAQLCLKLVSVSWLDFFKAHIPGIMLGLTTLAVVWPVTVGLRSMGWSSLFVLVGATAVTGIAQLLLLYLMPNLLLGEDGKFMAQMMASFVAGKLKVRIPGQMPAVKGENVP